MSASPFDVRPIAARLKELVTGLRSVAFAAEYAAIGSLREFNAPCAFVLPAIEKGIPHTPGAAPRGQQVRTQQMVEVQFGVVIALRSYRALGPEDLLDEWKELLGATRNALFGFVPDVQGARPISFVSGDLLDYDNTTALWADVFSTQHAISSNPTT